MASGILQEMTIDDVVAFKAEVVIMSVASTEPHGPIICYGSDYFQSDAVVRRAVVRANGKGARVLMYPTLPIGNNANFKHFPFACRVGIRTLMSVLLDIIQALEEDGIRKIVLINGHGGNTATLQATCREHFHITPEETRAFVCTLYPQASPESLAAIEHASEHAGESETSRQMYVVPELTRSEKLQDLPRGKPMIDELENPAIHWVRPWHLHMPMGGGGDTRKATVEKGKALIETSVDWLAAFLVELSNTPWNPHFPYPSDTRVDY